MSTNTDMMREVTISVYGRATGLAVDVTRFITEQRENIIMHVLDSTGVCTSFSILPALTGRGSEVTSWSVLVMEADRMVLKEVVRYIRRRLATVWGDISPWSLYVHRLTRVEERVEEITGTDLKSFQRQDPHAFDFFMEELAKKTRAQDS